MFPLTIRMKEPRAYCKMNPIIRGFLAFLYATCSCFALDLRAPYYSYTGANVNPRHPDWGAAYQPFIRYPVDVVDYNGPNEMGGATRPSPRAISLALMKTPYLKQRSSYNNTQALTYLGQWLQHDLDLREGGITPELNGTEAIGIPIPINDVFMNPAREPNKTMPFRRSKFRRDEQGIRQQINTLSAWVDGSQVYGNSEEVVQRLRAGVQGLLKLDSNNWLPMNSVGASFGQQNDELLLPMDNPTRAVPDLQLRASADPLINQNPFLLVIASVFHREHNRQAKLLAQQHPDWSDEQLFQGARRMVVAQLQALFFYEYLPALGIIIPPYEKYKPEVNPGIDNFFATATYRYGHSVVMDMVLRIDEDGLEIAEGHLMLQDVYHRPDVALAAGIDPILRGMTAQEQGEVQARFSRSVQNHLFGLTAINATDLLARNIQRGRDHGLPDYNTCREKFGLPRVKSFAEITSDPEMQRILSEVYQGNLSNIDVYVGGLAEDHLPNGAHHGHLFYRSFVDQMTRVRDGDPFYFEHRANGIFTEEEINRFRTTGLRDIILNNTRIKTLPTNIYKVGPESVWAARGFCRLEPVTDGSTKHAVDLMGGRYRVLAIEPVTGEGGRKMVSIEVEVQGTGWVGVGVAAGPTSRMTNADIMMLRWDSGRALLQTYHGVGLTTPVPTESGLVPSPQFGGTPSQVNGVTRVVFQRPLAAGGPFKQAVNLKETTFIFAFHENNNNLEYHSNKNREILTIGGLFSSNSTILRGAVVSRDLKLRQSHGILMAVNMVLVFPLGALMARNIRSHWISSSSIRASLFYVHMAMQITGITILTAGFIIAVTQFGIGLAKVDYGHGVVGVVVMGLVYSQLAMGILRPPMGATRARRHWELGHTLLGRSAIALGLINVFVGIFIINNKYNDNWAIWAGACAGAMSAVFLLQAFLDRVEKQAVDRVTGAAGKSPLPKDTLDEDTLMYRDEGYTREGEVLINTASMTTAGLAPSHHQGAPSAHSFATSGTVPPPTDQSAPGQPRPAPAQAASGVTPWGGDGLLPPPPDDDDF